MTGLSSPFPDPGPHHHRPDPSLPLPKPVLPARRDSAQLIEDVLKQAKVLVRPSLAPRCPKAAVSVSVHKGEGRACRAQPRQGPGVSVYVGQRRGNASTSDFSPQAIRDTVQAAFDIARHTAEDPAAGLPDPDDLASRKQAGRDLDLYFPVGHHGRRRAEVARRCEAAALVVDRRITNSEGAGVSAQASHFCLWATAWGSGVAMRRPATRCRWRRSPGGATTCSATPGYSSMRDPAGTRLT